MTVTDVIDDGMGWVANFVATAPDLADAAVYGLLPITAVGLLIRSRPERWLSMLLITVTVFSRRDAPAARLQALMQASQKNLSPTAATAHSEGRGERGNEKRVKRRHDRSAS
jgi:hypothetical protein